MVSKLGKGEKMAGYLLLAGGAEFQKGNEAADSFALEQAGGANAPVFILPTAAAAEGRPDIAGRNGVNWFKQLGAQDVDFLPVYSKADANSAELAARLANARLIYLSGGSPVFLYETLKDSPVWQAVLAAHQNGAILAGSSAGAMVLLAKIYNPQNGNLVDGFGLVENALFMPHFNNFGRKWVDKILATDKNLTLFGVEEKLAVIGRGLNWQVFGRGWATIYQKGAPKKFQGGQPFRLEN